MGVVGADTNAKGDVNSNTTSSGQGTTARSEKIELTVAAVITQILVKSPDQRARRAVCEVMVMTKAIAKLILSDQSHLIPSQLQTGREFGMQLFDQGALGHVRQRQVAQHTRALDDVGNARQAGSRFSTPSRPRCRAGILTTRRRSRRS